MLCLPEWGVWGVQLFISLVNKGMMAFSVLHLGDAPWMSLMSIAVLTEKWRKCNDGITFLGEEVVVALGWV